MDEEKNKRVHRNLTDKTKGYIKITKRREGYAEKRRRCTRSTFSFFISSRLMPPMLMDGEKEEEEEEMKNECVNYVREMKGEGEREG